MENDMEISIGFRLQGYYPKNKIEQKLENEMDTGITGCWGIGLRAFIGLLAQGSCMNFCF